MKKTPLINSNISRVISCMGHYDTLTIADAGLPVPKEAERIDLAVSLGIPSFMDVLKSVLTELEVQRVTIASEMKDINPGLYAQIQELFPEIEIREITHEEFKAETVHSKAVVRTGESKPYANIILESGVVF